MTDEPDADLPGDPALVETGLTLLGIGVSIGLTVGFGLNQVWWLDVVVGSVSALAFYALIWFLTRRSLIRRLALWLAHHGEEAEKLNGRTG
jgi:uncharacterized membrane protein YccC